MSTSTRPPTRGRHRGNLPRRQRGIAMLVAILLVALGTILAAAVAYESAMSARRGTATLSFDEALLVGEGAEALAAFGLQQILRNSKPSSGATTPDIYPGQGWDQPVGPLEVVPGVTLEQASLEDLQGRFNLNWLVDNQPGGLPGGGLQPVPTAQNPGQTGQPGLSPTAGARAAFNHLLEMLDIDTQWTDKIVDWIDSDQMPQPQGAEDSAYLSQNPPYLTANQYLTSITELLALGFGRENYQKLAPYITALPPNMQLNICSAPGILLDALKGGGRDFSSDPDALDKNRASAGACFPKVQDYLTTIEDPNVKSFVQGQIGTTSQYFRLTSLITIGTSEFNLYSLLQVEQGTSFFIHPIQRSFSPD